MLKTHASRFFSAHKGFTNNAIHGVGLITFIIGMVTMSLFLAILGAVFQETGHLFHYAITGKTEDSPLHSLKSHVMFAYPIFIALILWRFAF